MSDPSDRRSLLRHNGSVVVETDVRAFEDALREPDVHHLFPHNGLIAYCGMHRGECIPCSKTRASSDDVAVDSCSNCGRGYCATCRTHHHRRWGR